MGTTRYPRGMSGKRTDIRVALINKKYEVKLRRYDIKYLGASPMVTGEPEPPTGPLLQHLRSFQMQKLVAERCGDLCKGNVCTTGKERIIVPP